MTASQIRDLLKARAIFVEEYPNAVILANCNSIIEAYKRRVGIRRYLSEMLGPMATEPAREARYFDQDGGEMLIEAKEGENIQGLLRKQKTLPFRVEFQEQVRYL